MDRVKPSGIRRFLDKSISNARRDFDRLIIRDHPFYLVVMGLLTFFSWLVAAPWPKDDLLRDMVAFSYRYDYSKAFVYSPGIPSYDFDIGFDRICGFLYRSLPWEDHAWAVHLVQGAAIITYVSALLLSLRRVLGLRWGEAGRGWAWLMVAGLMFAVLSCGGMARVISGRQEVFLAAWAIAACAIPSWWAAVLWVGAGMVLAPCYWLSVVYTPAALMLSRRFGWPRALGSFGVLLLVNVVFWHWYSGGTWLPSLLQLRADIHNRVVGVGEDQPIAILFLDPWFWVIAFAFVAALWRDAPSWLGRQRDQSSIAMVGLIVWFLLPDMVRYEDIVAPLMAMYAARTLRTQVARWPGGDGSVQGGWLVVKGLAVVLLVFSSLGLSGAPRPRVYR
ncbi:MAG: hypothetical protein PHT60_16420, partial [Acidiphilium sp.]|nr:hypothetical protein [Acidiphilium sp.]